MKSLLARATLAITLAAAVAGPAAAHRPWLLPSATVLSGQDPWITVDAAVSDDLFVFDHVPLRLDGLSIVNPDGSAGQAENQATGKFRSSFDMHLTQQGTYKVVLINGGVMASWDENGQRRRFRGTAEELATQVPANAAGLQVTESTRRLEFFATLGKPTQTALKPTGKGLELAAVTHPNDLFAGEKASFRLLLDGQAADGVEVTLTPGGTRYRSQLGEVKARTDKDGAFTIAWPVAGMYLLTAQVEDGKTSVPRATKRIAAYNATFEVLSP